MHMQGFTAFARACGLDVSAIPAVGKIVRVPTFNKPGKKNGALFVRPDGSGWVIAYDGGGELQWYQDPNAKAWTEEEKAQHRRMRERSEAAHRADLKRKHDEAASVAATIIGSATLGTHGYLHRKGFPRAQGLVTTRLSRRDYTIVEAGELFIPMRHLTTGSLLGGQRIWWMPHGNDEDPTPRWEKKYLYGTDPKLAVLRIGPQGHVTNILCEGYATGLSIIEACHVLKLRAAVTVCFNDANIVRVAAALANAPYHRCVFADHDGIPPAERMKRDRGEPYETRGPGELAAIKTGLPYAMAPGLGDDANDHHQRHGVMELCRLLLPVARG